MGSYAIDITPVSFVDSGAIKLFKKEIQNVSYDLLRGQPLIIWRGVVRIEKNLFGGMQKNEIRNRLCPKKKIRSRGLRKKNDLSI